MPTPPQKGAFVGISAAGVGISIVPWRSWVILRDTATISPLGDAHVGLDDGHTVFAGARQHRLVLGFGAAAEGGDQQVTGAVDDRNPGDVGIPAVVADQKATAAGGRVDGASALAKTIESPGPMAPR